MHRKLDKDHKPFTIANLSLKYIDDGNNFKCRDDIGNILDRYLKIYAEDSKIHMEVASVMSVVFAIPRLSSSIDCMKDYGIIDHYFTVEILDPPILDKINRRIIFRPITFLATSPTKVKIIE